MITLIDGDIITYRCGFVSQHNYFNIVNQEERVVHTTKSKKEAKEYISQQNIPLQIEEGVEVEPVAFALHSVKSVIEEMLAATGAHDYKIYLSGKGNWRKKFATIKPYKGNRVQPKPIHYEAIRDYLIRVWQGEYVDNEEADDKIAEMSTDDTCVSSIDKDLDQIPGWHYNWVSGEMYNVNKDEANRYFWTQVLSGDPTDNILGIPGVGSTTANRIIFSAINGGKDLCEAVQDEYKRYFDGLLKTGNPEFLIKGANLTGHTWDSIYEENKELIRIAPLKDRSLRIQSLVSSEE